MARRKRKRRSIDERVDYIVQITDLDWQYSVARQLTKKDVDRYMKSGAFRSKAGCYVRTA
jgi:hypothetical protein